MKLRLPWELSTIYTENLRLLSGTEDQDEDDEDELEAQQASLARLKVGSKCDVCLIQPLTCVSRVRRKRMMPPDT